MPGAIRPQTPDQGASRPLEPAYIKIDPFRGRFLNHHSAMRSIACGVSKGNHSLWQGLGQRPSRGF